MPNLVPQELLDQLPRLYANAIAHTSRPDTTIYLHFSIAIINFDWWIAEYDGDDIFWGFANLNNEHMAEWGDISYTELRSIGCMGLTVPVINASTGQVLDGLPLVVEYDEEWKPKPFREIEWHQKK